MGKIVKLKNKKTGVRVYPVTATSAVVDADSGERLNDSLKNKVEEAPMDGAQYVRKNGTWAIAEVSMDSNEICRINLKSNQGDADNSSLNGATVNVVNTVTSEVIYDGVWDGTEIQLSIPGATSYKVTVGDVADYKTPDAITIEATAFSSRDLIMTYQTEVVSVTLSSDNGVSVVGQIVTINGKTHTWNGTAISQKVAFGVEYSVSVDEKTGFYTPSTQNLVAAQTSRHLTMTYNVRLGTTSPGFGIYIQGTDGYCYTSEEWDKVIGVIPNGIAVVTSSVSFVIKLESFSSSKWTDWEQPILVEGVTTTTSESVAISDYKGQSNTEALIADGLHSAANFAKRDSFPNGKSGYLGAAGEWNAVLGNKDSINTLMNKCGGEEISGSYWTSTQYDTNYAWLFGGTSIYKTSKLNSAPRVLAFTTL